MAMGNVAREVPVWYRCTASLSLDIAECQQRAMFIRCSSLQTAQSDQCLADRAKNIFAIRCSRAFSATKRHRRNRQTRSVASGSVTVFFRSEEHTSELQSRFDLV